jgi:hypothetical protein
MPKNNLKKKTQTIEEALIDIYLSVKIRKQEDVNIK